MVFAAILASGRGTRMGTDVPKQFLCIDGVPIVVKSLTAFLRSGLIDAAVITVPAGYEAYMRGLLQTHLPENRVPVLITDGGETRSDSLLAALLLLAGTYGREGHIVLTHDAVRPFIDTRIIRENIDAAREFGAANTCVPATDTVFLSPDGAFVWQTPPRATVFHSQTPQTFRLDLLLDAIDSLPPGVFGTLTDGCSVLTTVGKPVRLVKGSPENIKITFPSDLKPFQGKEPASHA